MLKVVSLLLLAFCSATYGSEVLNQILRDNGYVQDPTTGKWVQPSSSVDVGPDILSTQRNSGGVDTDILSIQRDSVGIGVNNLVPVQPGLYYEPGSNSYTTTPDPHMRPHIDPHVLPHVLPHVVPHWAPHNLPHILPHQN